MSTTPTSRRAAPDARATAAAAWRHLRSAPPGPSSLPGLVWTVAIAAIFFYFSNPLSMVPFFGDSLQRAITVALVATLVTLPWVRVPRVPWGPCCRDRADVRLARVDADVGRHVGSDARLREGRHRGVVVHVVDRHADPRARSAPGRSGRRSRPPSTRTGPGCRSPPCRLMQPGSLPASAPTATSSATRSCWPGPGAGPRPVKTRRPGHVGALAWRPSGSACSLPSRPQRSSSPR